MATRNKIARNPQLLRIECFDRIHDTLSIPSFECFERNARLCTPVYTRYAYLFHDSFRVSIHSEHRHIPPQRAPESIRERWAGKERGEVGDRRWGRFDCVLYAAPHWSAGREDARVKLVSGAKAGGWFSGLTPVYNSRTAPSGWNPPRTFHPEAIHHPLLLTPPPPRDPYPPSTIPPSPRRPFPLHAPCQTCRRGQFAKLITVG